MDFVNMVDDSLLQAWAVGGSWQGPLPMLGRAAQQALLLVVTGSLALGFGVGIFRRAVLAKQSHMDAKTETLRVRIKVLEDLLADHAQTMRSDQAAIQSEISKTYQEASKSAMAVSQQTTKLADIKLGQSEHLRDTLKCFADQEKRLDDLEKLLKPLHLKIDKINGDVVGIGKDLGALRDGMGELRGETTAVQNTLRDLTKDMLNARKDVAAAHDEVKQVWALADRFDKIDYQMKGLDSLAAGMNSLNERIPQMVADFQAEVDNVRRGIYECLDRIGPPPSNRSNPQGQSSQVHLESQAPMTNAVVRPAINLSTAIPMQTTTPSITVQCPPGELFRALFHPPNP